MYAIDSLQIGYGRNVLLTLEQVVVGPSEFICLLGRNGQGKPTLLRTLAGFIPAVNGEARVDGRPVRLWPAAERARKVAVVLTDRPQIGALRVRELVEKRLCGTAGTRAGRPNAARSPMLVTNFRNRSAELRIFPGWL